MRPVLPVEYVYMSFIIRIHFYGHKTKLPQTITNSASRKSTRYVNLKQNIYGKTELNRRKTYIQSTDDGKCNDSNLIQDSISVCSTKCFCEPKSRTEKLPKNKKCGRLFWPILETILQSHVRHLPASDKEKQHRRRMGTRQLKQTVCGYRNGKYSALKDILNAQTQTHTHINVPLAKIRTLDAIFVSKGEYF